MEDGVVIDTNIMSKFNKEYFFETPNDLSKLIIDVMNKYHLAINKLLENEWKSTCGSQPFQYWLTDNIIANKIEFVNSNIDKNIMKKIYDKYGLPKNSGDKELIKIANATIIKYILTEDIDLFDPKEKNANHRRKEKIKQQRIGKLNIFLKKKLNITVGLCCHCCKDLCL